MTDLTTRIKQHLQTLPPYVESRLTGKLLWEAVGEIERLMGDLETTRALITRLRIRFIGTKTPHPAHTDLRAIWDEMKAAEAKGDE